METINTKNSGYYYQNEPVLVYIMGFIGGIATFLKEEVVKDGYGRNVKNCVVRFLGEEDTRTVNDLAVFCISFMKDLRNLFAEIENRISLLRKTREKLLNCKKLYAEFKGQLPPFINEEGLRSHFNSHCASLVESIGKNLLKVDEMWENRDKELFIDMEMPGEILSLREAFARIKDEVIPSLAGAEEGTGTPADDMAGMADPGLVLVPAALEVVSADGSGPVPFVTPMTIPSTVAAAS